MKRGRIRWPLVAYDMLILLALDVLLLVLYRSSEHLSWSAILLHSGISFVCVFLARSRGNVYQQIWRYGGIQSYIRLLITDGVAFFAVLMIEFLLPVTVHVPRLSFARLLSIACMNLLGALSIRMIYRYAFKYGPEDTPRGHFLRLLLRIFSGEDMVHVNVDTVQKIKIAIIGAGPAGLSCAYYLANMGYENVTVFDKNEVPGGMLTLGIPSFRLEKDVVNAEIEVLREMGVHFQCGVEIGKDLTIDQLREQGYKGFYLAIGAQKSAPIGVPGEELSGVYGGVDFLRRVNLGKKPRIGKKCAVIGGGNVAMDVCRTAIRLGAKDTYIIYRRSQAEMPADAEEVAEAMEEGVQFRFLSAPAEILGENGKVKALKVELMELGEPDAKGRRKPVGTGKFETIEVTSVIGAIGQRVDLGHIAPEAMAFNRNGTVQADGVTYQTAQPDIFAGGDVVTGPKFAIDAIAAGREGAISLHRYVHEGQSLTLARDPREFYELDKSNAVLPIDCFDAPARQTVAHDASKAKTFSNDRITFTEAQVKAEASRCLGCGVSVVDQNKCIGCGLCTTRCEFDAIHLQRDMPEASRMYRTEDKMKAILPHMVKRAAKLTIKDIKGKRAK